MDNSYFDTMLATLNKAAEAELDKKGPDYAREGNRLDNFEFIGELLSGAPADALTVAAVYWLKHVIAICKLVRTRTLTSEAPLGRFVDERNYNALMFAVAVSMGLCEDPVEPVTEGDFREV